MKAPNFLLPSIILAFMMVHAAASTRNPEINLFNNARITISLEVVDGNYRYVFDDKTTEQVADTTFVLVSNDFETFRNAFQGVMKSKTYRKFLVASQLESETNRAFYFFTAVGILAPDLNYRPEAGTICMSDKLFIDEKLPSDFIIKKMAKHKIDSLKDTPDMVNSGFLKRKIFKYEDARYTKEELKSKLFEEISQVIVQKSRDIFYLNKLPYYKKFQGEFGGLISESNSSNNQLKAVTTEKKTAEPSYLIQRIEFKKSAHLYHDSLAILERYAMNGNYKGVFPDVHAPGFELAFLSYTKGVSGRIAYYQNVINDLQKDIDADTKKLKTKKINKDSIAAIGIRIDVNTLIRSNWINMRDELILCSSLFSRIPKLSVKYIKDSVQFFTISENYNKILDRYNTLLSDSNEYAVKFAEYRKRQDDSLVSIFRSYKQIRRFPLSISSADIEFNDAFIENILVVGSIDENVRYYNKNLTPRDTVLNPNVGSIKFENRYPMGFSRKRDYENLKQKHLFTMEGRLPRYRLHMEDLLRIYTQRHEVNRRDFSPADTVLRLRFDSPETSKFCHTLFKESTYRIFEAKIYSDFVGLDKSNPNGLIQTEIEKRLSLITNRFPRKVFKYEMWNFGFISYITPTLTLSKIESSNKDVSVQYRDLTVNGQYAPQKFVTTLELKRHENFSVGFDLNLMLLDIPTLKSTFCLDYGFRYGRVAVVDSLRDFDSASGKAKPNGKLKNYGVNTTQLTPRISWLIKTDERYSFMFSGSVIWYLLRANDFSQVANEEVYRNFGIQGNNYNMFANVSMLATLKTSPNAKGKLFFRYQYNWQWNYTNTGFHQAQVGYSFFIMGKNK